MPDKKQRPRSSRTSVNWHARADQTPALVRDFSPTGLYIETPNDSKIGSVVKLYIDIPGAATDQAMTMVVEGVVTRMENANGNVGIGIQFTQQPQILP